MAAIGGEDLPQWERTRQVGGDGSDERIRVSVRLRPLNAKESARNDTLDWECINDNTIIFRNTGPERSQFPTAYSFDRVFRYDCSTKQVYEEGAKEVALSVVSGINSSVFAYGQTSSGKTYTMTGVTECTVADIYDYMRKHEEREFVLKFSAMEIYNEAVRDLLSADGSPLRLLDDPERGTVVEKLTEETLTDESHLRELLCICEAQRQIGETSLNETSSRSHQILRLTIESSAREFSGKGNASTLTASVNFVDLAGSERASQTLSAGARLKEGCHINRSLLTLGTVIRKLSKGRNGHVPYRDSKLTRILQNSLGGNSRTAIICTMSPARSHVEQSRNTLLFASCAKEVSTSAQVNIVMSEKALVKHLQKELARLESELRYPVPTSAPFHSEELLREKDVQILKLEKEMQELIRQRDIAQSRLENLLQAGGDGQASYHGRNACENEFELLQASDRKLDFEMSAFNTSQYYIEYSGSTYNEQYLQHPEKPKDCILYGGTSPRLSISSSISGELVPSQGRDKISQVTSEDFEDLCKEVRCIEVEESSSSTRRNEEFDALFPEENEGLLDLAISGSEHARDQEMGAPPKGDLKHNIDLTYGALEKKLQNVQKTIDYLIKPYTVELSPLPLKAELSSSERFGLTRSRSCRATLMTSSSSPWFPKTEQNENTPPSRFENELPGKPGGFQTPLKEDSQTCHNNSSVDVIKAQSIKSASTGNITGMSDFDAGLNEITKPQYQKQIGDRQELEQDENTPPTGFEKDFPGRPGGFQRTLPVLNYDTETQMLSREASHTSEWSSSVDVLEAESIKNAAEERISSICTVVSEMKEMAKLEYQKQLADGQDQKTELKTNEEVGTEKTGKDVGLDPMLNPMESPSRWPLEFERQRGEIIELWHACNVSLAHRTYFFLLFKGDPTDSIYMEVELRRLSFLKNTFSQGDGDKRSIEGDRIASLASSARALRREREMLSKQMQKRLTVNERDSLYQKWGIGLDTKQRRLQLARLLWSETNNIDHARESATIVAKLVGFLESGHALKEMFGLSFTPQRMGRRSFSWIHQ